MIDSHKNKILSSAKISSPTPLLDGSVAALQVLNCVNVRWIRSCALSYWITPFQQPLRSTLRWKGTEVAFFLYAYIRVGDKGFATPLEE